MQSCTTLDDFLPGFRPQAIRPRNVEHCGLAKGTLRPPLNPQLPAPLPEQRAGSTVSRIPSPVPAWLTRRIHQPLRATS